MKKLTVVALFSLLSTGAALADGLSREQVVAELVRARNAGELVIQQSESSEAFGRAAVIANGPQASRATVQAELQRARSAGELQGRDAESSTLPSTAVSTKTRAEVRAELQQARARGELSSLQENYGG